jgi:hypothetical protein
LYSLWLVEVRLRGSKAVEVAFIRLILLAILCKNA